MTSPWVLRNLANAQFAQPRGSSYAGWDEEDAACSEQANAHYNAIYLKAVGGADPTRLIGKRDGQKP